MKTLKNINFKKKFNFFKNTFKTQKQISSQQLIFHFVSLPFENPILIIPICMKLINYIIFISFHVFFCNFIVLRQFDLVEISSQYISSLSLSLYIYIYIEVSKSVCTHLD
jgi:hypothetical protein